MTLRSTKISAVAAAIVIAFFSIYAVTVTTFTTTNRTEQALTVTLQMQSRHESGRKCCTGQTIPTNMNGDAVMGMTSMERWYLPESERDRTNPTGGMVKLRGWSSTILTDLRAWRRIDRFERRELKNFVGISLNSEGYCVRFR